MPLKHGFEYPSIKTYHAGIKGGKSCFAGPARDKADTQSTPMITPGPQRYNPDKIKACKPNIKGGTAWRYCANRFKEDGILYTDSKKSLSRTQFDIGHGQPPGSPLGKSSHHDDIYSTARSTGPGVLQAQLW